MIGIYWSIHATLWNLVSECSEVVKLLLEIFYVVIEFSYIFWVCSEPRIVCLGRDSSFFEFICELNPFVNCYYLLIERLLCRGDVLQQVSIRLLSKQSTA